MNFNTQSASGYAASITQACRDQAAIIIELLNASPERRNNVFVTLTLFCLILTYRHMAIGGIGFFKAKSAIDALAENIMEASGMQELTKGYKEMFKRVNKEYGSLPLTGDAPAGTLLWEYSKYVVVQSQIKERKDFFKTIGVSESLMATGREIALDSFVRSIK